MNKKVLALVVGLMLLAAPVMAAHLDDDENWRFNVDFLRYRFDWEVASDFGTEDSQEYFDDDFDTTWRFNKGDIELYFELEIADSNMGDDVLANAAWDDVLGAYGAKWMPESMADSAFTLQVGDFGTGFGKAINNDDSPRGSVGVSWKMGDVAMVLEYGRRYEGCTNDDECGDAHLFRGQVHMPIGENFNVGAYGAFYNAADQELVGEIEVPGSDVVIAAALGDESIFLGAVEMSGSVGGASIYSEIGFAAGSRDAGVAGAFDEATGQIIAVSSTNDVDLSGFYAMGGASFDMGQVTLGVEAGFSPGDDNPNDDKQEDFTAVNTDFWIGQILHDEGLIVNSVGKDGGISNLLYAQVTAGLSPTEKMGMNAGLVYLKPAEEVGGVDTYGVELFGDVSYKLSDNLKYVFYWGYAIPDEDFIEDNQYQFTNRLEFKF